MTSVQRLRDQRGWIIGAAVLCMWTAILGFVGYRSEIPLWLIGAIFGILFMLACALSGGSDGSLAVDSFLFLGGWFCASACGYLLNENQYGLALMTGFLAFLLQGLGFLHIKSCDG